MRDNRKNAGLLLIFLIIIGDIVSGAIGIGSPVNACPANVHKDGCPWTETGTAKVTIPSGITGGSQLVTFPQAFFHQPPAPLLVRVNQTEQTTFAHSILVGVTFLSPGTAQTWSAMPTGLTEIFGNGYHQSIAFLDASPNCIFFVNVVVAGTATAILRIQYSPDDVSWFNFDGTLMDLSIAVTGLQLNTDTNVPLSSRLSAGEFLRVVGFNGNGVVSPQFGNIGLSCAVSSYYDHVAYIGSMSLSTFVLIDFRPSTNDSVEVISFSWSTTSATG
jgi:hypothetical protein